MAPTRRLYLIYKLPALSPHLPFFFPRLAQQVLVHSICRSWHESWNLIISGGLEGKKKKKKPWQGAKFRPMSICSTVQSVFWFSFIVSAEISGIKGVALAFILEPRRKDTRLQLLLLFPCVYSLCTILPLLLLSSHPDARKYTLQVIPVLTGLRSPMNNTDPISSIHYSRLTVHLADTSGVYI